MILWGAAAFAQSALMPPLAGLIRDAENRLRPVFGVAGSYTAGDARMEGVSSLAFHGRGGLAKTADSVWVLDEHGRAVERLDAPAGEAMFAFGPDGAPAFIYYRETSEIETFRGSRRTLELPGVAAIGSDGSGKAQVLFVQDGRLWLASLSEDATPGPFVPVSPDEFASPPPALLPAGGVVSFVSGRELVLMHGTSVRRLELPGVCVRLEQMSEDGLILRLETGPALAVRGVAGEAVRIYRLPEAKP